MDYKNVGNRYNFTPCPYCGGNSIGVKDHIVSMDLNSKYTKRQVWAYCRNCDHETSKVIVDIPDDDDYKEIEFGVKLWNRECGA